MYFSCLRLQVVDGLGHGVHIDEHFQGKRALINDSLTKVLANEIGYSREIQMFLFIRATCRFLVADAITSLCDGRW